jgi:hypothetical protein
MSVTVTPSLTGYEDIYRTPAITQYKDCQYRNNVITVSGVRISEWLIISADSDTDFLQQKVTANKTWFFLHDS